MTITTISSANHPSTVTSACYACHYHSGRQPPPADYRAFYSMERLCPQTVVNTIGRTPLYCVCVHCWMVNSFWIFTAFVYLSAIVVAPPPNRNTTVVTKQATDNNNTRSTHDNSHLRTIPFNYVDDKKPTDGKLFIFLSFLLRPYTTPPSSPAYSRSSIYINMPW